MSAPRRDRAAERQLSAAGLTDEVETPLAVDEVSVPQSPGFSLIHPFSLYCSFPAIEPLSLDMDY